MKNWKLPLIIVGAVVAVVLWCVFGVQSVQNRAISLEESVINRNMRCIEITIIIYNGYSLVD